MWQLRKLSTQENLNEPQLLPENWGPIFGLSNFKDRLNDLSWVGKPDMGWFEVGPAPDSKEPTQKDIVDKEINKILKDTTEFVAADNTDVTKGERADWITYRQLVKDIPNQEGYPDEVFWPKRPDVE